MGREIDRDSVLYRMKRSRAAYFFLLPLFLGLALLKFKPLIEGIRLSFYEASLKTSEFVGFDNYTKLWGDPIFWTCLKNTLFYVVFMVPFVLAIPLFISLIIHRFGRGPQSFFRAAFYLPSVSAGIVMSLVWLWMFDPSFGILNYVLSFLGIEPITWLAQPSSARFAVCLVQLSWSVGIPLILYLSALAAIPKMIYESAIIDGANWFQCFIRITLPLIMPTIVYVLVMETIARFQTFSAIFLLTAGGPAYATMSLAYRIYHLGFSYFRFGEASAYGVVLLLITFIFGFFQFRYLSRKLEF